MYQMWETPHRLQCMEDPPGATQQKCCIGQIHGPCSLMIPARLSWAAFISSVSSSLALRRSSSWLRSSCPLVICSLTRANCFFLLPSFLFTSSNFSSSRCFLSLALASSPLLIFNFLFELFDGVHGIHSWKLKTDTLSDNEKNFVKSSRRGGVLDLTWYWGGGGLLDLIQVKSNNPPPPPLLADMGGGGILDLTCSKLLPRHEQTDRPTWTLFFTRHCSPTNAHLLWNSHAHALFQQYIEREGRLISKITWQAPLTVSCFSVWVSSPRSIKEWRPRHVVSHKCLLYFAVYSQILIYHSTKCVTFWTWVIKGYLCFWWVSREIATGNKERSWFIWNRLR